MLPKWFLATCNKPELVCIVLETVFERLTLPQEIFNALVYVCHPLSFLSGGGSIDSKRFGCSADEPTIAISWRKQSEKESVRLWQGRKILSLPTYAPHLLLAAALFPPVG